MTTIEANGQTIIEPKPEFFISVGSNPESVVMFALHTAELFFANRFGQTVPLLRVGITSRPNFHDLHTFHRN